MLIPYQSDAPVHYFPWGTIGIIAANILIFIIWVSGGISDGSYDTYWVLWYDQDFHFIQILTSMFAHADIFHLLGNMIFLWTFGLIVEGKMGWKMYVPVYFVMGILVGILELILMGGTENGSLGASSVITGLMVCSLFWAPLNRVDCLLIIFFPYTKQVEFPVWGVAGFFIFWDLILAALIGFGSSTPLLHVLGAIAGIAPAYFLLKKGYVDCEGWDLLTIKKNGRPEYGRKWQPHEESEPEPEINHEEERQKSLVLIREYIKDNEPLMAERVYKNASDEHGHWKLEPPDRLKLIQAYLKNMLINDALPLLEEFHREFDDHSGTILQLATIYIIEKDKPSSGLEILDKLKKIQLNEQQQLRCQQLRAQAQKMIDSGVLELE